MLALTDHGQHRQDETDRQDLDHLAKARSELDVLRDR